MRLRDRWPSRDRPVSLDENAVALAYICWQVALNGTKNLHTQAFDYEDDRQRVAVIREYLAFVIHICDRMAATQMQQAEREQFLIRLIRECARHLNRNTEDVLGPGDYASEFIETFNARSVDFGQCAFKADGPGYTLLRTFGARIQRLMGHDQTNRWVIDQVMAIDGPDAVDQVQRSMRNILDTSARAKKSPNTT